MIKNLIDIIEIADKFTNYLKERNHPFTSGGFPKFDSDMFLNEYPDLMIPHDYRNSRIVKCPERTLLCSFCSDRRIYPRLEKIFQELPIYKSFMAVAALDITVTKDMEEEWQDMIMLVNQLYMAIAASNGIKIVANMRAGSKESWKNFEGIPKGVMWTVGFLGCDKDSVYDNEFISKVLSVQPSKLAIYGKRDLIALEKLELMGYDYRIFDDFHKMSKLGSL